MLAFIISLTICFSFYTFLNYLDSKNLELYENYNIYDLNMFENSDNTQESELISDDNKLVVKKTNKYDLVYKHKGFSVWEPRSIDDYFPLGHIVTKGTSEPFIDCCLVNNNKVPDDFMLITYIDKIGIWKPICKDKNFKCLSYLFSKKKPSVNRIRCVHTNFLDKSNVESIIHKFKNIASEAYNIWSISNSNYFITDAQKNSKNGDIIYSINQDSISPNKLARIQKTKKYKKIIDNEDITVWRPSCSKHFNSLGDIVLPSKMDPNNNLETVLVHDSLTQPILHFEETPSNINNKGYVWKPISRDGYTTLGSVVTKTNKEPNNKLISSIPLEYLEQNKEIKSLWNSYPNKKNKCSVWSNNNYCNSTNNFEKPKFPLYKIILEFTESDSDFSDISKNIVLDFKTKNKNISKLNISKLNTTNLNNSVQKQLALKLDINPQRLNVSCDIENNKIYITINPKTKNSNEKRTNNLFTDIQSLANSQISIKINNVEVLKIIGATSLETKNKISLDNNIYLKKMY